MASSSVILTGTLSVGDQGKQQDGEQGAATTGCAELSKLRDYASKAASGSGSLSPSRAIHTYKVGNKMMLIANAATKPPTITMAKGRWESEPMACESAAGTKPKVATSMVIMMGRSRRTAPSIAASTMV